MRNRVLRIGVFVLIVLVLIAVVVRLNGSSQVDTTRKPLADFSTLSDAQWKADVETVAKQLPRLHKNAYANIDQARFQAAADALLNDLPSLDGQQTAVHIMQLVAMIGDAHTQAAAYASDAGRYPLMLEWFKDGLFVTQASTGAEAALGARVVGIGSMSIDDAYAAVASVISHENDPWLREMSQTYLVNPQILQVLGVAPTSESAVFTFQGVGGRQFSLELQPLASGAAASAPWNDAAATMPLYRQRHNENYWFKYLPESRTMYLKYNACANSDAFAELARQFWAEADRNPTERVVVDLRANGGGDSRILAPIISGIVDRPSLNQRGRVFAITDRGTFSSGMLNAIDLRDRANALIYGEPTGGKPNSYGEVQWFLLPNSHITITYSTKYFRQQRADTPSVMPDVTIELTSADYLAGQDPVLAAILSGEPK